MTLKNVTKKYIFIIATTVLAIVLPITMLSSCSIKSFGATALIADKNTNMKTNEFTKGMFHGAKKADPTSFVLNVKENATDSRVNTIEDSMARGTKTFILGSYSMDANKIAKKLKNKGKNPTIISVDKNLKGTTHKNVFSVSAKAQESAFLAGYLIAQKMHDEKFKDQQAFKDGKLKFGYIGGYKFPSVTDFYYGIINGIDYYEKQEQIAADNKIIIIGGGNNDKSSDKGYFANNWDYNSVAYQASWQKLLKQKPDVIIGSPENVINYNLDKKTGQKIFWIGADTDVTLDYADDKKSILLSIIKDLGEGIKRLLVYLKIQQLSKLLNDDNYKIIEDKKRFLVGGIDNNVMRLAPGVISQEKIDEIYKKDNHLWDIAKSEIHNNVIQKGN